MTDRPEIECETCGALALPGLIACRKCALEQEAADVALTAKASPEPTKPPLPLPEFSWFQMHRVRPLKGIPPMPISSFAVRDFPAMLAEQHGDPFMRFDASPAAIVCLSYKRSYETTGDLLRFEFFDNLAEANARKNRLQTEDWCVCGPWQKSP